MEHRAFLYGALVDAPQGVYRPPVRREISQWGRGPFGGTIEDNHFPKLQSTHLIATFIAFPPILTMATEPGR